VASFVGDTNKLRGRLIGAAANDALIALGTAQMRVPGEPLSGAADSAPVDVFVRPEQLRIVNAGEPCAMTGNVVAQVYQGGHVDLQIACKDSGQDRLLVRSAGDQAVTRWPLGTEVGISIDADGCAAFPAE
jgi:ABC-type Fe3+/spermidine/putrescine transport system ATPase subunit